MGWCAGRAPSVVAEGDGPRDSVIHGMARIGKVLDRLLPNISLEAVLLEPSVVPGP